jgi:hypothetical protein
MKKTSKPKIKIEFAPGCFDDFEGSQAELAYLIREIEEILSSETLMDGAEELTEDELDEIWASSTKNIRQ